MSKSRIIVNGDYINEHAAVYRELKAWINDISEGDLECPIMFGMPNGKIYAIRKPVEKGDTFFQGESIEVETKEDPDSV